MVFMTWIAWAICIGWGVEASANLVTLGIVPWVSCAAMVSSYCAHAGARWLSAKEKGECWSTLTITDEQRIMFGT